MKRAAIRAAAVLGFIFFAAGLWAETPASGVFRHPLGPETMDAFETICTRLGDHPFIKGSFEQEKRLRRLGRSLKSQGNFIIAADLGMVWETARPFPSTLTLGKDYLIQSRPGGQKTLVSARENETFVRLADAMSAVFSGSSRGLLENFKVYFSGNPAAWELGLLPLDKAIDSFAEAIVMKGDDAIRSILIDERNGDAIAYALFGHSYPAALDVHEKAFFALP